MSLLIMFIIQEMCKVWKNQRIRLNYRYASVSIHYGNTSMITITKVIIVTLTLYSLYIILYILYLYEKVFKISHTAFNTYIPFYTLSKTSNYAKNHILKTYHSAQNLIMNHIPNHHVLQHSEIIVH